MTSITSVRPNNRISLYEINAGNGQLGTLGYSTDTNVNLSTLGEYCSSYYFSLSTTIDSIQLPIIGTTGVSPGWKTIITVEYPNNDGTVFSSNMNSLNTISINNHLGANVTSLSVYPNGGATSVTMTTQVKVIALVAPGTWCIEKDFPIQSSQMITGYKNTGMMINYINGTPSPRQLGPTTRLMMRPVATNVNVLFIAPAVIPHTAAFSTLSNTYDTSYYTPNGTFSLFTINISGVYYFNLSIVLTNSGGGTIANFNMGIRKNGGTLLPAILVATPTLANGVTHVLYSFGRFASGDTFEIIAGKTVISVGVTTYSASSWTDVRWVCT